MKIDETKHGFSGRELLGEWKEYNVFEPVFDDDKIHLIGYPKFILVDKNGNERWQQSIDEAFEILDFFKEDEQYDDDDDDTPINEDVKSTIIAIQPRVE